MSSFDRQKALDQVDGDQETLALLISTLKRVTPKQFEEMSRAIEQAEAEKLASVAHCLKGSLGVFAADAAAGLARQVESSARMDDFVSARRALKELEAEYARLEADLTTFLNAAEQPSRPM